MTKRVRTLETLGSLPYTTVDGGKWLKKALDPVDLDVEVQGLPDTSTNARCVLNYQFQGDIPVPHSNTYVANTTQSYDVDFYTFQNPVTLGMSASRPAGTKNPVGGIPFDFTLLNGGTDGCTITLPGGYAPSTVQIFENPQIEGTTKNEKLKNLEKYCQRHRMIYGGVQCIPACSALFDSGTIEATQQIFSPQEKNINDDLVLSSVTSSDPPPPIAEPMSNWAPSNNVLFCQRFEKDDFPDEGSSIQNPAALYCRYKEGLYMPYKIRNPLVYEYKSSEKQVVTEAPYIVTDHVTIMTNVANVGFTISNPVYDPEINGWKSPGPVNIASLNVYFHCVTKTGVPFYIVIGAFTEHGNFTLPEIAPAYHSKNFAHVQMTTNLGEFYTTRTMGANFTAQNTAAEVLGKSDAVLDIPYKDNNIGIICFRSIGLQASIRVIFRFGLEMMITAGSVYTPFKHKSPKYDQKALNSYIKASHNMRDAFLGNAATPEGHAMFAAHIAAIAAGGDDIEVSNQGSRWYGQVSV